MRLALARAADHPISRAAAEAGWTPVEYPLTRIAATGAPPPQPLGDYRAVVLLSPGAAWALRPWLDQGSNPVLLVQGRGTLDALGDIQADVRTATAPSAEGIWDLLRREFPEGGSFLLARAERSRGFLEEASAGTPWRLWPWITHREEAVDPLPPLPEVDAVLALSPLQAELLAPLSADLLRFGWGGRTLFGFRKSGLEPTATCEPRLDALVAMLRQHLPAKVQP